MERPWLILGRILHVDPPGDDDLQADAVENATAIGEAGAEAQAQHAAVGEAQAEEDAQTQDEQHVAAAVDAAAVEGQDEQQAAVGEADVEYLQAQLEESVVNVNTDAAASEAAHAARGAAAEPDFTISFVAPPPLVTYLIAGPSSHPDPERPDMYPYVIAAGRFCHLVHFAVAPSYGTNFSQEPSHSHLVVVRHFRRAGDDGQIAACAVRVPDRPNNILPLINVDGVGLICDEQTGRYQIAELVVTPGCQAALLVHISSDTGVWQFNLLDPPVAMDRRREWVPHGTVTINSTVLWFDLSWGIISCDLAQQHEEQFLVFHLLPRGRVLRSGAMPDLHCRRCIAVSENLVRYVEIIVNPPQAATVNMWYRDVENNPEGWTTNYSVSFEDIWDDDSYTLTGLPRNPPMLVGVSPADSNLVIFTLDQRLFAVDVPKHRVVDYEQYEPLNSPGPPDEPVTSRYLITWDLVADDAINVGHEPDEPSDHGDSSDSGAMDEGEIDYQTPSE